MDLRHGDKARIARKTGYSKALVSHVLKGERRAPLDFAVFMERTYGIDRRSWYWPDEFANPLCREDPAEIRKHDEFVQTVKPDS